MNLPRGSLVRSRVVSDPARALAAALDREFTGYAVFEPQDAVLLDADAKGVLTFEDGVPVLAYHTSTDRGGPNALTDLAVPGPYSVDLYRLDASVLSSVHETPELRVPPGMPAERLGDNPSLSDRTRTAAPAQRLCNDTADESASDSSPGAVEAFLEDEERIASIREEAQVEAKRRAEEWGLDAELE